MSAWLHLTRKKAAIGYLDADESRALEYARDAERVRKLHAIRRVPFDRAWREIERPLLSVIEWLARRLPA